MLKSATAAYFLAFISIHSAAFAQTGQHSPVPLPRPKPSLQIPQSAQIKPDNHNDQSASSAFKSCVASLSRRGVAFVVEKPVQHENGCEVSRPVRLTAIAAGKGSIALPAQPLLNCGFALRLATWLSDVAAPVVQSFAKIPLKSVATGPGYVCRTRNNKKGGKISEHGYGNAIDITGFRLASGKNIPVSILSRGASRQVRMLSALRTSSCGYFTTVLGPGANADHKSHFHFDYGKHGRTWNYRICE